jgi:BirA family biotin operon repressor/biotin-[acetyl-CoA-carboxylase] ligase
MTCLISPGISAERIAALCGAAAQRMDIRVVAQTGSTNDDLLAEVRTLERPVLLWALAQHAGRGRAGRTWHAAEGATLTFSLAWKFALPLHALAGLPLAVGVTVAEVLASYAVDVRLKWPNDLLRDGRKLGGVLIEAVRDAQACWAVIGIGINMAMPDEEIAAIAAAAPELQDDRAQVIAALATTLAENLTVFEQQGFAAFAARWNARHAHAGRHVNIVDHGTVLHSGRASGVDAHGRLLLQTMQGEVAVVAGDVSLRATEN